MDEKLYKLFKEICPDFGEYTFLETDLYKGKIIGGFNLYYKKGADNKEGMITGKKNIAEFGLEQFPMNFITYGKFSQTDIECGWCNEELFKVLHHIKSVIDQKKR